MDHNYAMIMAGGGGTRLWPMSRADMPKQLLPLVEEQSMFRVSVDRLSPLFPPERIYVVAGRNHVEKLRADAPSIPAQNFIVEPYGRDSGPAAALGIAVIQKRDPEAIVAVLTADHHIANKQMFREVLGAACKLALHGHIVTLGISPSMPSTAFGYIRRGNPIKKVDGFQSYESLGFTEKPDTVKAIGFIRSGDYSWNSGMFIWTAERAMAEYARQQPQMHALITRLQATVDTPDYDATLDQIWAEIPRISIDFAVMEGAQNMAVIPIDIGWSDVGSWDALFDVLDLDEAGNGHKGAPHERITVDTKNTLVYSDKLTVTIGIENLVIVDTQDVLMICHKERTQDVKKVVTMLRDADNKNYL